MESIQAIYKESYIENSLKYIIKVLEKKKEISNKNNNSMLYG